MVLQNRIVSVKKKDLMPIQMIVQSFINVLAILLMDGLYTTNIVLREQVLFFKFIFKI